MDQNAPNILGLITPQYITTACGGKKMVYEGFSYRIECTSNRMEVANERSGVVNRFPRIKYTAARWQRRDVRVPNHQGFYHKTFQSLFFTIKGDPK